mmetsp:Transcript_22713/g.71210  ORF Transcript_22713/g.71210 Transcript_22713/m.71210 type:complete len:250 (+) Transcript_22713:84-833(+)
MRDADRLRGRRRREGVYRERRRAVVFDGESARAALVPRWYHPPNFYRHPVVRDRRVRAAEALRLSRRRPEARRGRLRLWAGRGGRVQARLPRRVLRPHAKEGRLGLHAPLRDRRGRRAPVLRGRPGGRARADARALAEEAPVRAPVLARRPRREPDRRRVPARRGRALRGGRGGAPPLRSRETHDRRARRVRPRDAREERREERGGALRGSDAGLSPRDGGPRVPETARGTRGGLRQAAALVRAGGRVA